MYNNRWHFVRRGHILVGHFCIRVAQLECLWICLYTTDKNKYFVFVSKAFYVWVGRDAPIDVIQALFSVPNFGSIPENLVGFKLCNVLLPSLSIRWKNNDKQCKVLSSSFCAVQGCSTFGYVDNILKCDHPWGAGCRSGESTRFPPVWPGFDARTRRHMWVEFAIGFRSCSEGFFSGSSGFSSLLKTNVSKFQFDLESEGHRFVSWKTV